MQWLGTGLTAGYLSERLVRLRVRPGGFDAVETPIVVVGWGGAIALAVLARRRPPPSAGSRSGVRNAAGTPVPA